MKSVAQLIAELEALVNEARACILGMVQFEPVELAYMLTSLTDAGFKPEVISRAFSSLAAEDRVCSWFEVQSRVVGLKSQP